MTCTLTAHVYDKSCLACMIRKIKSLRSPDKRLTLKLQLGTFAWMGPKLADQVKEVLRNEP